MGKLFNLKSYANKHLICIRNIASHTAAIWRVKKLNLKYHFCVQMAYRNMDKLLIKKKTEEQVCHDFDQFLPLNAVVKG